MAKQEIPLREAFNILSVCAGVMLEHRFIEPSLVDIESNDDSNEWMSLQWEEEYRGETIDVIISFNQDDNKVVILEGSEMTLVNTEGEEETFALLREWIPLIKEV